VNPFLGVFLAQRMFGLLIVGSNAQRPTTNAVNQSSARASDRSVRDVDCHGRGGKSLLW